MRKIVAGLTISLDGVIEAAEEWMGPWFNPELGQAIGSMMAAQDAMLLGRVTYEMFAAHWPHQTGDLADTMNNTAKYVVSGTLKSADWQNSTLISATAPAAGISVVLCQSAAVSVPETTYLAVPFMVSASSPVCCGQWAANPS